MEEVKTGRPTKYNEERVQKILKAIVAGSTREAAAGAAGIGESTMYEWMHEVLKFPEFAERVQLAEQECENALLITIRVASQKDWHAAAWMAEKKYPDRYGNQIKVNHAGVVKYEFDATAVKELAKSIIGAGDSELPQADIPDPEQTGTPSVDQDVSGSPHTD